METAKRASSNKVYWIILILSIIVGVIFYVALQEKFELQFLVFFSGVPFFLFVIGSFGLVWPRMKPSGEGVYISHALLLGLFFMILFFIHVWVILPRICPEFGNCLGI